ncbi:hypothetical protein [Pyrinomonas methylaliphatogenes]|uniref:Uncharacterized protein n=1 Tax=Pyrinomonas methylaliphatogenes TaxID=454194 RepID=A0A0B6WY24_9BACT|nr:hypothetical protein [Pyrinomonas methylaliphatogenes]CDM65607.1 hypothetical protein PYK22_01612 [Pyrinomonas methylaliphatogenes]
MRHNDCIRRADRSSAEMGVDESAQLALSLTRAEFRIPDGAQPFYCDRPHFEGAVR